MLRLLTVMLMTTTAATTTQPSIPLG